MVGERLGQRHPSGLLDQGNQVDQAEPETAVGLGHGQPGHAEVGQCLPTAATGPSGTS